MNSKSFMPVFAIIFGCLLLVLVAWQLHVGKVYSKSGVSTLEEGGFFLVGEFGIAVYIVVKGFRGLKEGCWPPSPPF